MGWTSNDDMINQMTNNGKADGFIYQKTTVAAGLAGHWQHMINSIGTPPAATFGGAELTFVPTDNTWSEGAIQIADQTAPATKHLTNLGAGVVAAAGAPWIIQPIDFVGYVKLTTTNVSTTGVKTVTMTPIGSSGANVDRYAEGAGLRMFVAAFATMGANAPTMQITYTNSAGATGRVTTAGCVSTASAPNGILLNTGNAANKHAPFLSLQGNDVGVKDIESITWGGTAHASGSVIIGLCKPLGNFVPCPQTGLYVPFEYGGTSPSFPRLPNGANLQHLLFGTGITTSGATFYSGANYGWGG